MPGPEKPPKKIRSPEERIAANHANNAAQRYTLAGRQAREMKLDDAKASAELGAADLQAAADALPKKGC